MACVLGKMISVCRCYSGSWFICIFCLRINTFYEKFFYQPANYVSSHTGVHACTQGRSVYFLNHIASLGSSAQVSQTVTCIYVSTNSYFQPHQHHTTINTNYVSDQDLPTTIKSRSPATRKTPPASQKNHYNISPACVWRSNGPNFMNIGNSRIRRGSDHHLRILTIFGNSQNPLRQQQQLLASPTSVPFSSSWYLKRWN